MKLNDVVEVFGVLSRVPELAQARMDACAANGGQHIGDALLEEEAEELAAWQPTSLVRLLHFLMVQMPDLHAMAVVPGSGCGWRK